MKVDRRLNGITAPIGTILGPDWSGMFLTVDSVDEQGVTLRPTVKTDFSAVPPEPRSLTEYKMMHGGNALVKPQPKVTVGRGMNGKGR